MGQKMGPGKEKKIYRRLTGGWLGDQPVQNLVVAHSYEEANAHSLVVRYVALGTLSPYFPGPVAFGGPTAAVGLVHINTRAQRDVPLRVNPLRLAELIA